MDRQTPILCRTDRGSAGRNITVVTEGPLPIADFYTEFIPNRREYRIHVFRGDIIRVQGKYLDYPEQRTNEYIKNHANGYRFRDPGRTLNSNRLEDAIKAVEVLGLDFGAVDLIIADTPDREHYILEVNTAPACSPLTLAAYSNAIRRWYDGE